MAVDTQDPGDIRRYLLVEIGQRRGELVEFSTALRQKCRQSGVEKDFRLKHEAIADHADIRPVAENSPEFSEELRPVTREFLYPLRQSDVQPLTEIGDLALRFLVALLRSIESFFKGRKLTAQCADL